MIVKPNELDFSGKTFTMIIYGSPGVGKTTLALSAPKPLLIDFDRGVSRVKAYHRCPTIVFNGYDEVLNDLQSPEMKDFETIVIDTVGSFVTCLQNYVMEQNPSVNRQKNGAISLKGFGAVKAEFERFSNYVRDTLRKNVIFVFHSDEQKDKDGNPMQRLLCEGSAKNAVWRPADFGGYVQMIGDKRTISFSPTEEYYAKGCCGIEGTFAVPTVGPEDKNDFLTTLFVKAKENIAKETEALAPQKEAYNAVMAEVYQLVDDVKTLPQINDLVDKIKGMKHALTSKEEAWSLVLARAKELGFKWNKKEKQFIVPENASAGK